MKRFQTTFILTALALFVGFASQAMAHEYDFVVDNNCARAVDITLHFTCGQSPVVLTVPGNTEISITLQTICKLRKAVVEGVEIDAGECHQFATCCVCARLTGLVLNPGSCPP